MPRIARTIIPRIKKSLRERGLATSIRRSLLLPIHLLQEYRETWSLRRDGYVSEFDRMTGLETDGDYNGWTYLTDLDIPSPNWIEGSDYAPIEPERFMDALTRMEISFEDYTFIDFGSGKGRALLLASEFPFKRIIGLEFSLELHKIAEKNIGLYRPSTQKCRNVRSINIDCVDFELPSEPSVLYFFDSCRAPVLEKVLAKIGKSLASNPRSLHITYISAGARMEKALESSDFLRRVICDREAGFISIAMQTWQPESSTKRADY